MTAYRWFQDGKLPVSAKKIGGLILVDVPEPDKTPKRTVVYARVSSADQKSDLDIQVARVTEGATSQDIAVDKVVTEVGSALNGHRRKFLALLKNPSVSQIIVEHRDRFVRFATEYVEAALEAQGRKLIVMDPTELDDDLVRDMGEILTSFCARLCGRPTAENTAGDALTAATSGGPQGR